MDADTLNSQFETLAVSLDGHVAQVELDRADKMNAMNAAMWRELQSCFEALDAEPEVRVVVLSGRGKHFCAGLDLGMFADLGMASFSEARRAEQFRLLIKRLQGNLSALEQCRKPVLAAVHRGCVGGGVDMICCADMRYCSADAYFTIKEIDLGMTADVGTLQRLPRIIGDGMVREMTYTGRQVGAEEALRLGLVNRVYPDHEALLEGVMAIAREIATKSPLAVRGCKEMLLYSRDHSVQDALNYVATWNAGMLSMQDVAQAIDAQGRGEQAEFEP